MGCPCFGAFYSVKMVTLLWKRSDGVTHCDPMGIFLGAVVPCFFFFFLFMNSLSSAKGASRDQFSASVPTKTWKNVDRRQ